MIEELDVYVFLPDASDDVLHKLEHIYGVRSIATLSGPNTAIAVATLEGYEKLEVFLDRVRQLGDPPTYPALRMTPNMKIMHSPRPPVLFFIQLQVDPAKVSDAFDTTAGWADDEGWHERGVQHLGSSIVAGDFDILVEAGGETFDDVRDVLIDSLSRVGGLVRSVTSFAFVRFYRKPSEPDGGNGNGNGKNAG